MLEAITLLASTTSAAIKEHTFNVENHIFRRLCGEQVKTVVNGSLPGPEIRVRDGDTVIVHVLNNSPYNITIHWHGVYQLFSAWSDGPAYVTQCPILPRNNFTHRFNVTGQEGTLWWHSHISMIRETIYGALIILPRQGRTYPFPKPHKEFPILIGERWNANVLDVEQNAIPTGSEPVLSDAFTINGQPGDLYPCSKKKTYTLDVVQGKTYLIRMINAAMMDHFFFKIANHKFTVVAVDARYTEPYNTDTIVIAPGQSADVLFTADQPLGNYYMASRPYSATPQREFPNGTTTGIVRYVGAKSSTALMPTLPGYRDTATAHKFYSSLTSLTSSCNPHWLPVPLQVDENMFVTINLGIEPCGGNATCSAPLISNKYRFSSNINNVSFVAKPMSILEAYYHNVTGIYTDDFPDRPPLEFNYTDPNLAMDYSLIVIEKKETRVKRLKYNAVVEIVLQNTALVFAENHPMHFHGFDFYVLAQGFGNYDPINHRNMFNLVNPQQRNNIVVPIAGWAVIRFRANNPGVWFVHSHHDTHVPWGLNMAFLIENGPTPSTSLPPPPSDFPKCF